MNRDREFGFRRIDDVELIHSRSGLFPRPPLSAGSLELVQEFRSTPTATESLLLLWFSAISRGRELIAKCRRIQMAYIAYLWYFTQRLKRREKYTWFHDAPRKNSSFEFVIQANFPFSQRWQTFSRRGLFRNLRTA
jgi:hypothetical protein